MTFRFVPSGDRLRPRVERHVQDIYHQIYDAVVRHFPDLMIAEVEEAGTIGCAAGLRCAADGFFSECYVDEPLETLLSSLAATCVGRDRIIEVTNLASRSTCSSKRLIENIIAVAREIGTDWAVFTITPRLKQLLCRMNLPVVVLGTAERCRVTNPEDWGHYYETGPLLAAMQDPGPALLKLTRVSASSTPLSHGFARRTVSCG